MDNWKIENLSKKFDDVLAVDNVTLEIEKNKIYGLIGRNGAGKTTFLKLLANQLYPSSGVISNGNEGLKGSERLTSSICLAREAINNSGITKFSPSKIFDMAEDIYPDWDMEYCQQLIEEFELDVDKKYVKLSKGMHTVIGIIIGLSSRASLTLFDEPYVGLDPVAREIFYELLVKDYEEHPRTIIISSHLINELENLFERVLIIRKGSLLLNEDMEEIQSNAKIVSGAGEDVERFLQGKKVVYKKSIGRLANYTVLDTFSENELKKSKELNLTLESVNLQKLFVNLSKGGLIND